MKFAATQVRSNELVFCCHWQYRLVEVVNRLRFFRDSPGRFLGVRFPYSGWRETPPPEALAEVGGVGGIFCQPNGERLSSNARLPFLLADCCRIRP